jgi:putative PIN family toxin of toxin-antitoxin system
MRVVLDTNVLISAVFFSGPPSRILSAWIDDRFDLVVSTEILEEYREVARRIGARFPGVELRPVLDRIALHALLVVPVQLPDDACADRDDVKFLECALGCRADCVVSGDHA